MPRSCRRNTQRKKTSLIWVLRCSILGKSYERTGDLLITKPRLSSPMRQYFSNFPAFFAPFRRHYEASEDDRKNASRLDLALTKLPDKETNGSAMGASDAESQDPGDEFERQRQPRTKALDRPSADRPRRSAGLRNSPSTETKPSPGSWDSASDAPMADPFVLCQQFCQREIKSHAFFDRLQKLRSVFGKVQKKAGKLEKY